MQAKMYRGRPLGSVQFEKLSSEELVSNSEKESVRPQSTKLNEGLDDHNSYTEDSLLRDALVGSSGPRNK